MKIVYLSLGSNLGDRERTIREALLLLRAANFRILRISPVYETDPVERLNQPSFMNLAVEAETGLFPKQLLAHIQKVEARLGRKRVIPKGPRTIDIDILFYGNAVVDAPELTIPHPGIPKRRFVLQPMADLVPDLRHPVTRRTISEMLAQTLEQSVRRLPLVLDLPPLETGSDVG